MKNSILIFILLMSKSYLSAQEGSFTWVTGVLARNGAPVWGTQGVAGVNNTPGSRESANIWVDAEGDIWLFGGAPNGYNGLGDLWHYDMSTGLWTWKKGVNTDMTTGNYGNPGIEASTNRPGARFGAASWIDDDGNLWLFGGNKPVSSGSPQFYNDLWKYNPQSNNWTWMNGSNQLNQNFVLGTKGVPSAANTPCASSLHAYWKGNDGTFWLFGGIGRIYNVQGYLNQLWNYNPATNEWTWVSGGNNSNQNPVWGTTGVFSVASVPSSRFSCAGWMDNNGFIYIFGGNGIRQQDNTVDDQMNDLWKFNPATNQWAVINGVIANGTASTYGVKGVENATNHPGSRSEMVYWSDDAGDLWFFGGHSQYNGVGLRADMWRLNTTNNYWTYMNGTTVVNGIGNYGQQNTASTLYFPGSRYLLAGTKDSNGDFWLIGGMGKDNNNQIGTLGDIWKYDAVNVEVPVIASVTQNTSCGSNAVVTVNGNYLSGATVTVGGQAVSPTQISDTQIQFNITPALSGSITVSNEYGQTSFGNVSLSANTISNFTISSCEPYVMNNVTYNSTGTFTQQLQNTSGCDSTIVINFTRLMSTSATLNETACSSFTLNGLTYNQSGTYTQTLENSAGCDSLITLQLIITQPNSVTLNEQACESFILNDQTYTASGQYTQVLTNDAGCDSIIFLNLEISHPSVSEWSATSCDELEWNGILYSTSGEYVHTLTNAAGCDSIVTLNLQIIEIDNSISVNGTTINATPGQGNYQWINCDNETVQPGSGSIFSPEENGNYAVVITQGACTSTSDCVSVIVDDITNQEILPARVYPNPFNHSLMIEWAAGISITIHDLAGRCLLTGNNSGKINLDTQKWATGFYVLTLNSESGPLQFTMIKM